MARLRSLLAAALFAVALVRADGAIAGVEVDIELVLAVDVSRSIDDDEFALQRQGYADAFLNPAVLHAIQGNTRGQIAVTFIEYAGAEAQHVVVPWTVVSDAESGAIFAEQILKQPRSFQGWTSISGAIDFAMQALKANPHKGTRRIIDVSGDGINNSGRPSNEARDEAVAAGITINGIVIMNEAPVAGLFTSPQPALDDFYRDQVIGGGGAFLIVAEDFQSFAFAIVSKLIREIAAAPSRADTALAQAPRPDGRVNGAQAE